MKIVEGATFVPIDNYEFLSSRLFSLHTDYELMQASPMLACKGDAIEYVNEIRKTYRALATYEVTILKDKDD